MAWPGIFYLVAPLVHRPGLFNSDCDNYPKRKNNLSFGVGLPFFLLFLIWFGCFVLVSSIPCAVFGVLHFHKFSPNPEEKPYSGLGCITVFFVELKSTPGFSPGYLPTDRRGFQDRSK
jgi:hypothetical protein